MVTVQVIETGYTGSLVLDILQLEVLGILHSLPLAVVGYPPSFAELIAEDP